MYQLFIMWHRAHLYEKQLIHSVESVVIEWCHLIRDVLNKSSAETLLAGMNPGPLIEIEFWNSRCADLESVEDQVRTVYTVIIVRGSTVLLLHSCCSYIGPSYSQLFNAENLGSILNK